jgi:hypothetical protein
MVLAVALALFGGAGPALATHGQKLDHYKCYGVQDNTSWAEPVRLRDQFTTVGARVLTAVRFCNPTEKTHNDVVTPITNPFAHLTMYRLSSLPATTRQVEVLNQFNTDWQPLTLGQAVVLAVPTKKNDEGTVENLDHFMCYRASGQTISQVVSLRDQALMDGARVLAPALHCNPTDKLHDGVATLIQHPDEHLVCYTIRPQPATTGIVRADNQFGLESLNVTSATLLCVPSQKRLPG